MTDEAQRIAIAEACGWTEVRQEFISFYGRNPGNNVTRLQLPDYLNDLDAMHEAEKTLKEPQRTVYLNHLYGEEEADNEWKQVHATARQRAEAFLRTVGKWEDA